MKKRKKNKFFLKHGPTATREEVVELNYLRIEEALRLANECRNEQKTLDADQVVDSDQEIEIAQLIREIHQYLKEAMIYIDQLLEAEPYNKITLGYLQKACLIELENYLIYLKYSRIGENQNQRKYIKENTIDSFPEFHKIIKASLTLIRKYSETLKEQQDLLMINIFSKNIPYIPDPYLYFMEVVKEDRLPMKSLKTLYNLLIKKQWKEKYSTSNYLESALSLGKELFGAYDQIELIIEKFREQSKYIKNIEANTKSINSRMDEIFYGSTQTKEGVLTLPLRIEILGRNNRTGLLKINAFINRTNLESQPIRLNALFALASASESALLENDSSLIKVPEKAIRQTIYPKGIAGKSNSQYEPDSEDTSEIISKLRNDIKEITGLGREKVIGGGVKKGFWLNIAPKYIKIKKLSD